MSEVKKIATRDSYGAALVELGKKYQTVLQKGCPLASPEVEIGKVVFAAPLTAVEKKGIVVGFAGGVKLVE